MKQAKEGGTISWHSSRAILGLQLESTSKAQASGAPQKAPWSPNGTLREREKHSVNRNSMHCWGGQSSVAERRVRDELGIRDEVGIRDGSGGAVCGEEQKPNMRYNRMDHLIGRKIGGRLYSRAADSLVRLRNTFGSMDTEGAGRLSWEKIRDGLRKFRVELTAEEGTRVLERLDADASGRVDYNQLLTIFAEGTPGSRPRTATNVMLTTAPWDLIPNDVKPTNRAARQPPLRDRQLYKATAAVIERRSNRLRILLRREDPGRSGRVNVNAFRQGLAALRYNLTEEQVRSFLTMAKQKDVEHGVNYEQLVSLFDNFEPGPSQNAQAAQASAAPDEASERARALAADLARGKVGQLLRNKVAEGRKEKIMQIFRRHDLDDDGSLSLGELRQSMGALLPEGVEATAEATAGSEDARVDYKALVAEVARDLDGETLSRWLTGMGQAMGLQGAAGDASESSWMRTAMRAHTADPSETGTKYRLPDDGVPSGSVRPATAAPSRTFRRISSGGAENGGVPPRPSTVASGKLRSRFAWNPPHRDTSTVIRPLPGSPGYCSDSDRLQSVNALRAQSATPDSRSTFSQALTGRTGSPSRKRAVSTTVLQELATTNDAMAEAKQTARIARLTNQKQRYMEMCRAIENEKTAAAANGAQTFFSTD